MEHTCETVNICCIHIGNSCDKPKHNYNDWIYINNYLLFPN